MKKYVHHVPYRPTYSQSTPYSRAAEKSCGSKL